jgi:murein DD-endopeptidase MepM/ murein hydrolase activator NlpD
VIALTLALAVGAGATAIAQQLPGQAVTVAPLTTPVLAATINGGVFPVFGDAATFTDTYGAPRAGTGWHQGADIFAPIGTPVLAVADGQLSSVGVNTLGGNRLWLRDGAGTTYYYAHLSAYAPGVGDGVVVKAGQVIAFVGNTGQAITTPPHLHFEIHPGDGASINPTRSLTSWRSANGATIPERQPSVPAAGEAVPADASRPTVRSQGAVLVGVDRPAPVGAPGGDGTATAVR